MGEQKKVSQPEACAAPVAKFAITMQRQGKEQTTDIPFPSPALEVLALEAMSRDLDIAGLIRADFGRNDKEGYDPQDNALRRSRPLRPNPKSFSRVCVCERTRRALWRGGRGRDRAGSQIAPAARRAIIAAG